MIFEVDDETAQSRDLHHLAHPQLKKFTTAVLTAVLNRIS